MDRLWSSLERFTFRVLFLWCPLYHFRIPNPLDDAWCDFCFLVGSKHQVAQREGSEILSVFLVEST